MSLQFIHIISIFFAYIYNIYYVLIGNIYIYISIKWSNYWTVIRNLLKYYWKNIERKIHIAHILRIYWKFIETLLVLESYCAYVGNLLKHYWYWIHIAHILEIYWNWKQWSHSTSKPCWWIVLNVNLAKTEYITQYLGTGFKVLKVLVTEIFLGRQKQAN